MLKTKGIHHILIMGGAGGLGTALAQRFLAAGDRITLVDNQKSALVAVQRRWSQIQIRLLDITDTAALSSLASKLGSDPEGPDIIINNAGIHIARPLTNVDYSIDEQLANITQEIQINFTALAHNCALWRPYLETRKGQPALVNIASALAFVPKYTSAVYCGCKAAVDQFSSVLRMQLETSKIRVVTVYPPLISTAMTRNRVSEKNMSANKFADIFYYSFSQGKDIIRIGEVRWLYYLNKIAPHIAAKFIEQ